MTGSQDFEMSSRLSPFALRRASLERDVTCRCVLLRPSLTVAYQYQKGARV